MPPLRSDHHQCPFRGIPVHPPALLFPSEHAFPAAFPDQPGIVAEDRHLQQSLQPRVSAGIHLSAVKGELPFRLIAGSRHFQPAPVHPQMSDGHLVLGQCPGLIRTDHRGTPQGLYGRQLADNGPPPNHPLHPEGQSDGDNRRQSLRDRGHRQTDTGEEHFVSIMPVNDPGQHHHCRQEQGDNDQYLPQLLQPVLQRGLHRFRGLDQVGDLAHLRLHSGEHHHPDPSAPNRHCPQEGHIFPISQGNLLSAADDTAGLADRYRLPGESRFFNVQILRVDQAQISGNPVPTLNGDDISRYQLRRRNPLPGTVPLHPGHGGGQLLQRL